MLTGATKAAALLVTLSLVAILVGFVFRRWIAGPGPIADDVAGLGPDATWYDRTGALAAEVRRTAADLDSAPYGSVQRRFIPLASRLRGQARRAPDDVEDALLVELNALATDCQALGMEYSRSEAIRSGVFLEDRLADLEREAASVEAATSERESAAASGPEGVVGAERVIDPR